MYTTHIRMNTIEKIEANLFSVDNVMKIIFGRRSLLVHVNYATQKIFSYSLNVCDGRHKSYRMFGHSNTTNFNCFNSDEQLAENHRFEFITFS